MNIGEKFINKTLTSVFNKATDAINQYNEKDNMKQSENNDIHIDEIIKENRFVNIVISIIDFCIATTVASVVFAGLYLKYTNM